MPMFHVTSLCASARVAGHASAPRCADGLPSQKMASRHPLAFAIVRRSAWSIPRFRTDFLRFTSHIVEQSRYLPPRKSCHVVVSEVPLE